MKRQLDWCGGRFGTSLTRPHSRKTLVGTPSSDRMSRNTLVETPQSELGAAPTGFWALWWFLVTSGGFRKLGLPFAAPWPRVPSGYCHHGQIHGFRNVQNPL